ncbi:potassium channel family protein [Nitriliruptor alkaliphilus]|uniref:potassium channel family protein n=1 Tax=Nitriliruptor alkaliphilus TaxID=427918 RepID=UPI0006979AAF|nr:NAD-binding protein [Nitriliruptor alkaliphilus]
MKTLGVLLSTISAPLRRWNVRLAAWMMVAFVLLVLAYSAIFHELMAAEGRSFTWGTSIYWTLTTMSTLGYGDITFESDIGRLFSMVVLITGAAFILVLLPFVFIQFIFTPWMDKRESARAPRELDADLRGHIVLTHHDVVTDALIDRAKQVKQPYVLVVAELVDALRLHDEGYDVMLGALDDPATYRAARVEHAALVATTSTDTANTNIVFTVREMSETVPIVATANSSASIDILELAGADQVLHLGDLLGRALARRVVGGDARTHVVGAFGALQVAEASVSGTELVGHCVRDLDLRDHYGINALGVWRQGRFERTRADTELQDRDVLILAGTEQQLAVYDATIGSQGEDRSGDGTRKPVLILGGGRVGRAAGRAFEEAGVPWRIVEQLPDRIRDEEHYVLGDAAELEVLERAGLHDAAAVLVTTHEDDVNVYLTLYVRRLRPDVQIIARSTLERNVSTLHRAGADAVLSYASLGATALWNAIGDDRRLVVAEGLEVFQVRIPDRMVGHSLRDIGLGERTGCDVLAIERHGIVSAPDPGEPLPSEAELVIIGDEAAEHAFLERFPAAGQGARGRRRARTTG